MQNIVIDTPNLEHSIAWLNTFSGMSFCPALLIIVCCADILLLLFSDNSEEQQNFLFYP
jgi:hypothetical protein